MSRTDTSSQTLRVDLERVARARACGVDPDETRRLSSRLSLLADPVRARVLYAPDEVDELCVRAPALDLDVSEDAVDYGLRLSRSAPEED